MKRNRLGSALGSHDDPSSGDDGGGPPFKKYTFVSENEDTNEIELLSSDDDYQTSDEDYEDFYDEPLTPSDLDDDDDDVYDEYDSDYDDDEVYNGTMLANMPGGIDPFALLMGAGTPVFGGPFLPGPLIPRPMFFENEFLKRDFFLFSDGFINNYKGDFQALKEDIKNCNGRVVSNAEAFFRFFLLSNINKKFCEQEEKYTYLLGLGEQKSVEELKSLLSQEEIDLLKTDSNSFGPSKFQMLNPNVYLVCTEDEGRNYTPLFAMVNSFTDFSDLPHSVIMNEKGLEVFLNEPRLFMNDRTYHLTNPIPLTKCYGIMAESPEKKEEIRKFLLDNGATNVIDNFLDSELVMNYNSFAVIVSDTVLEIIEKDPEALDFEALSIGVTSSFNDFYMYSTAVSEVKELKRLTVSGFARTHRGKILSSVKELILKYRRSTRKMLPEDQIQEFPSISPSERLSSLLPNEVFFMLLKYLPVHEILNNFSITCKRARKMCFADHLWKDICLAYSSNHKFLNPFTKEENLARTKLPHYYIFRNIINPILIDYHLVTKFLHSKCDEEPNVVNFTAFNDILTTGLYIDRHATEDSKISIGASKMFGSADLPIYLHNTVYGTTPLLLQLNITELREKGIGILSLENSSIKDLFPQSGMLYFFKNMMSDRSDDGLILHYDGDLSQLKRTEGEKLATTISFYEALCIPKRSEMVYSKSIMLNGLVLQQPRDFMDASGIDDLFSQLIHAKYIREDATKLFGALSCFTEGEWYGFLPNGDDSSEEEEGHFSRCLDKFVDLKNMLSPIFQLSGKYNMGRRMDAVGFAALTTKDKRAKWKLVDPKMPNVYTLEFCYLADFYNQVPTKFRKAYKNLIKQFRSADF